MLLDNNMNIIREDNELDSVLDIKYRVDNNLYRLSGYRVGDYVFGYLDYFRMRRYNSNGVLISIDTIMRASDDTINWSGQYHTFMLKDKTFLIMLSAQIHDYINYARAAKLIRIDTLGNVLSSKIFYKENNELDICEMKDNIMFAINGSHSVYTMNEYNYLYYLNKETLEILKEKNIQYSVATVSMKGITIGNSNTDLFKIKRTDCVRLSGKGNLSLYSKDLLKTKLITEHRFKHKLDASRVMHSMKFHNCFGSKIYIDTDLDIYPCAMERRFTLGNLNKKSLNEIIKPNEVSRLNKDKVDGCKVCEYRYACHDCRPDSLSDNIYAKPWNCTYDPYKGVWEDPEKFIENLLNM